VEEARKGSQDSKRVVVLMMMMMMIVSLVFETFLVNLAHPRQAYYHSSTKSLKLNLFHEHISIPLISPVIL
jgi:hypothetical protein